MGMGPPINGGIGAATISGPGSAWANNGGLFIGGFVDPNNGTLYPGNGALVIADGGSLTSLGGPNSGVPDAIGLGAGSIGTAVVTDPRSQLTAGQNLAVGIAGGTGALTVQNNGAVNVAGIFGVGIGIDPYFGGTGTLNVMSGGTVSAGMGGIIGGGGAAGTVMVAGTGSALTVNGGLFIGGQTDLQLGPGIGTVTIAENGAVSASGGVTLAPKSGSFGTLNIGAALGNPAVGPGILNTPAVTFGNGTGAINFNHTGTDYVFAPAISGPGAVNQLAGTTILTGNSTYTGATTIAGGALRVNGSLGNTAVTVSNGGTLGGSGLIAGPVMVGGGGIVAPGNSIGTLTLSGNLVQASGSIYQVELNATGQADHLIVGGTATLQGGATVQAVQLGAGSYVLGTSYPILTAAGGIRGAYSGLTGDVGTTSPFLSLGLFYDQNNAYLDVIRNGLRFADVGLTFNQRATGAAVENLGFGNPLYQSILSLSAPEVVRQAFDALSGEIHASAVTAAFEDQRLPREAIFDRLSGPLETPLLGVASTMTGAYAADLPSRKGPALAPVAVQMVQPRLFGLWGQGFGDWGKTNGDHNAAKLTRDTGGFIIGADAERQLWNGDWRFGVAGGYTDDSLKVQARSSSGDYQSIFGALYGKASYGAIDVKAGAILASTNTHTSRSIIFPGFFDAASSSYGGYAAQGFGELGYRLPFHGTLWSYVPGLSGLTATYEPFLQGAVIHIDQNRYVETALNAGLVGAARGYDLGTTTLGLRTQYQLASLPGFTWTSLLGWRHAFGDVIPKVNQTFAGSFSSFTVAGVPIDRDAFVSETSLDYAVSQRVTVGVSYSGQYGRRASDTAFKGHVDVSFW